MAGPHEAVAKITRPLVRGAFPRDRLFEVLDNGRKKPIIWISGPAGSGKTTLVASYLDAQKLPCLWYRVDERDMDIATFFYYIGLAAKKAAPRYRKPLPLLTPEYLMGVGAFTHGYFEQLFARLKPPFVLVFDNYQDVSADSGFHQVVGEGLSQIPEGITVIFMSRREPPPVFSRLRANNRVHLLGWDELRFTPEESKEVIRSSGARKIPDSVLDELHGRTQGWAAGLVLLLEKAKNEDIAPGLAARLSELSQRSIFDYFANEIFRTIDEKIREFLLKTAFLPKVTVAAAKELTGTSESERILSYLSREHFFTEKHAGDKPFYTYHPLFSEFLLVKAAQAFSDEDKRLLRSKAASLLIKSGEVEDAARLFLDAGDWEGLTKLILANAQHLLAQGRGRTLEEWLSRLPAELFESEPWLKYWMGACSFPFNPKGSEALFKEAFGKFRIQRDALGIYLSWAGVVEAIEFAFENFRPLDDWIAVLNDLIKEFAIPSPEIEAHVSTAMLTALIMRCPWHRNLDIWKDKALSQKDVKARIRALFYLNFYNVASGNREGGLYIDTLRKLDKSAGISPFDRISIRVAEELHYIAEGSYDEVYSVIAEGLAMAEESGCRLFDFMLLGHGATAAFNQGDLPRGSGFLEKMRSFWEVLRPWDRCFYHHLVSTEAMLQGDIKKALRQIEICLKLSYQIGADGSHIWSIVQMARILNALGEYSKAEEYLSEVFRIAEDSNNEVAKFAYYLEKAALHLNLQDGKGLENLRTAMAIGREKGYTNTFFPWRRPEIARLCALALENNIEPDYVRGLIKKRKLVPETPPLHIENWPWPLKIHTLGRFELLKDDIPVAFSGKVQKKPLELLKLLISGGGKEMGETQMTDILWPDADGDMAHSAFTTTLSRLRKLLGNENIVRFQEGKASLDQRYCWIDTWAFERILCSVDELWREGSPSRHRQTSEGPSEERLFDAARLTETAFGFYKGHFLPDDECLWAVASRERLRSKFLGAVTRLGRYYEGLEHWERTANYYERGIEVDDLAEEFYQGLMACHHRLGQRARSIAAYRRCREVLSAVLGVAPSPKTEEIYRMIMGGK